jgi:hypothetical protein
MHLSFPLYALRVPPISFPIWSPEYLVRTTDHNNKA